MMKTTKFILTFALLIQLARSDESCAETCHEKAQCRAYDTGRSCCKCEEGFVGNGIGCHERESSVVIRGKLNGAIDNVKLEDLDLSGYVLTQAVDPRSFVSIGPVPSELGNKLSLILPTVTSLHWLFAADSYNNSLNGFSLTGGVFTRQSDSTFFDEQGTVIGTLFVSQNFTGLYENDLQIETHIDAQLPPVSANSGPPDDQVIYLDYDQDYQYSDNRENPETHKVIEAKGSIIYKVSNVFAPDQLRSYRIEINKDTIHFVVCPELNDEKLAQSTASVKLFTKKLFTKYSNTNRRVEFTSSNSIRPEEDSSPDPCDDSDCSPYAECINDPNNDKGYDCICKSGFEGDGTECRDVNECREGSTYCSPHAECINLLGGYECKCIPPRVGNGQTCEEEVRVTESADDREEEEQREPETTDRGDEEDEDVDTSRNYCNRCDPNAQCGYDHDRSVYFCRCNPGYSGDGLSCENEQDRPTSVEPEATTTEEPRTKLTHSEKCEQCHKEASCEAKTGGECCSCRGNFVGNGKYCFKQSDPILIRGKVKGTVNGHKLANMDLYSYVFTAPDDTRNFIGVGQIPTELGGSFQALIGLVSPINWMFAAPGEQSEQEEGKKLINGFTLTGGAFSRRSTLTYLDEESGASTTVTLTQEFYGLDNDNNNEITVNTEIDGQVPEISAESQVVFKDYKQEYQYESRGFVRSYGDLEFKVTSTKDSQSFRSYKITYSDEITFSECPYSDEEEAKKSASVKVNSKRVYVTYTVGDGLTKFNSINFMHAKDSPDHPCEVNRCSVYAECTTDFEAPEKYVCSCKAGFEGDGFNCYDVDECQTGEAGCDQNSVCYNFVGHFECRCRAPYRGNGRQCFYDFDCNSCDRNAQCVEDASYQKSCRCNDGYEGDGLRCTPVDHGHHSGSHSGDDCSRCTEHETCERNPRTHRFECKCKEGFEKRYGTCTPLPCNQYSNCDYNADCQYSQQARKYECKCRAGYHGDGHSCSSQTCDVQNNCDEHANCVPDPITRQYSCVCSDGYLGNGYECVQDVNSCKVMRNCDQNAECLHDQRTNRHTCKCRSGFEGDGYQCRAINSCTRDSRPSLDLCDENADCVYDQRANDYVCKCKQGYEGNGLRAKCFKDESQALHLVYAQGTSLQRIGLRESEEDGSQGYQIHKKRLVYIPGQTAVGVAYDCQEDFIYWSDVSGRMISKIKPDGSKMATVLQDVKSAEGLAIDWLSRNVYFTDSVDKTIEVASLNGLYRKVLIKTGLNNPRGIAVDPVEGYMFWTDWNRKSPKIERANLDGSYRQVIISSGLGVPNGIYYDLTRQEICWGDAKNRTIECSSKDGSNRRIVSKQENIYPFDLIGFKSTIYWSDWSKKSIQTVDKDTQYPGSPLNLLPGGNGRVYGVSLVVSKCPPEATNGCDRRSDCRQLCLPLPGYNYQCACSDDANGDCLRSLRIRT